jgi:hypothetical protein
LYFKINKTSLHHIYMRLKYCNGQKITVYHII